MTFRQFKSWCEHPLWAGFFTVLLSPVWVGLGLKWCVPVTGLVFALGHEGLQVFLHWPHEESWKNAIKDIGDFMLGTMVASGVVWLNLYLS